MNNIPNHQKDFDTINNTNNNNHKDTFSDIVPGYIRHNRRMSILKVVGILLVIFVIIVFLLILFAKHHNIKDVDNNIYDNSIQVTSNTTVAPSKGYVSVKSANVRSSPNKDSDDNILLILYQNDMFDIISFDGYWYKIYYDGTVGYISHKMIEVY
ncbi:MAG: SH3 domain-containing protein [Oscillospiraceae bacterium]